MAGQNVSNKSTTYVLSHEHLGVHVTEGLAHNANLLGGNIVNVNEEALGVSLNGITDTIPNLFLTELLVCFLGHFSEVLL